ncbi:pilus assembly protein TadG [Bradyrhizobium macuxiense]|uniref:Pilus assembly protein TadG n=1 Tax=Bradyrhizobium macuxiense TaxID=1755647 RepID=A0A109J9E4_9BRAD|nr:TadE/TadG family type IV pilus assembly protein [Bradyrhizobium macuxiense]KWV44759.1 pilus assembly protein TadG [Bradyrhizobium macuxiense]
MSLPARFSLKLLHRFRRNRRGSAAVEFALIAPLFFGLLFAIIETAMIFFAGQVLETVAQDSARVIMTGQAQNGQVTGCSAPCTQAQFKSYVCSQINALFDCVNGIYVDVRSYPANQFGSVNITPPIDSSGNFLPTMQYNIGASGSIVVVRLFYQWPLFVTALGFNSANLNNNKRLLTATAAFKNEPF